MKSFKIQALAFLASLCIAASALGQTVFPAVQVNGQSDLRGNIVSGTGAVTVADDLTVNPAGGGTELAITASGVVAGVKLTAFTSTTGSASINIPPGAVPSSPVNGDLWLTSSGLFARVNGSTVGPYVSAAGVDLSGYAALANENVFSVPQFISLGTPQLWLNENDVAADNRAWAFGASGGGACIFAASDDAMSLTNGLCFTRSGATITNATLTGTSQISLTSPIVTGPLYFASVADSAAGLNVTSPNGRITFYPYLSSRGWIQWTDESGSTLNPATLQANTFNFSANATSTLADFNFNGVTLQDIYDHGGGGGGTPGGSPGDIQYNNAGAFGGLTGTNNTVLRWTSGAANFGQLTASMFPSTVVPDAALSANVPLLNAANSFTSTLGVSGNVSLTTTGTVSIGGSGVAITGNNGVAMTPETFTQTNQSFTGFSTTYRANIRGVRIGQLVTIWLDFKDSNGTSNATSFSLPAGQIPANFRPASTNGVRTGTIAGCIDNGAATLGEMQILTDGSVSINKVSSAGVESTWTSSSTKGCSTTTGVISISFTTQS